MKHYAPHTEPCECTVTYCRKWAADHRRGAKRYRSIYEDEAAARYEDAAEWWERHAETRKGAA